MTKGNKGEKFLAYFCLLLLAVGFLAVGGRSVMQIASIRARDYREQHPSRPLRITEEAPREEKHPSVTYSYYSAMNFR